MKEGVSQERQAHMTARGDAAACGIPLALVRFVRLEQHLEVRLHDPLIAGAGEPAKCPGIPKIRGQAGPLVTIE
jgi:hypothetical protein